MFKVNDEFETYGEFNEKLEKWARENFFMVRTRRQPQNSRINIGKYHSISTAKIQS